MVVNPGQLGKISSFAMERKYLFLEKDLLRSNLEIFLASKPQGAVDLENQISLAFD
jgi:hypothetical protein